MAKEARPDYEKYRAEAQKVSVVRMPHINPGYVVGHGDRLNTKQVHTPKPAPHAQASRDPC